MKNGFLKTELTVGLLIIFLFNACTKNKGLNDSELDQAFTFPLGTKKIKIDDPTIIDNTSNFYYNGKPYLIISSQFQKSELINFSLDSINKVESIREIDFLIKVDNSYPVNAYLQIYLLNSGKEVIDSFFIAGKQKASAGTVNILAEPETISTIVFETKFQGERLNHLKNSKYLRYFFNLDTKRDDGNVLRMMNESSVNVTLGMRIFLKYKLNAL